MKKGNQLAEIHTQSIDKLQQTKANKVLCASLLKEADALLSDGEAQSALAIYCKSLSIDPGQISVIHKLGKCLEQTGDAEDAALCFRGVIPDNINLEFFQSDDLADKMLPAGDCVDVTVLDAYSYNSVELTAPKRNPLNTKKYGQFNYAKTEARASFCTVADNGSIWFDGFNTLALDCKSNVISEHTKGNEFACYNAATSAEPIKLNGTACFLDARSSVIYYHWMLDVFPKLGVLEKAGLSLDSIDYFLVDAKSKFQQETLKLCGIEPDRIITTPVPRFYTADKVIMPYLRNDVGEKFYQGLGVGLAEWVPAYLQHRLQPTVTDATEAKRIYVSRSSRGSRNIANEAEIVAALKVRGFEVVEFEDYSVVGQAELMATVEMVIGVHGAGFTNLAFCKPGTKVIEIFGDYVVPCYWTLCAVAGLEYAQFMAASVAIDPQLTQDQGTVVKNLRELQIDVEPEEFIAFVDSILDADTGS